MTGIEIDLFWGINDNLLIATEYIEWRESLVNSFEEGPEDGDTAKLTESENKLRGEKHLTDKDAV